MTEYGAIIAKLSKGHGSKIKLPKSYVNLATIGRYLSFDISDRRIVVYSYEEDTDL